MKLCVPIPCFFGDDFAGGIRTAASLGYKIAEIYNWKNLDFSEAAEVLAETGVELRSMCTTEFRMTDPAYREAWVEGLAESCEAANRLGVTRLITQVGQDTGAPREEQHASILRALELALPILQKHDIILMPEPLNPLVDHPGYYLTRSDEAFDLIHEVNDPHVKIVFDIYHQQITEGNIIPNIVNHLDCIAHLHSAGHPGRIELQKGENDYRVIFDAVSRAGYTGACGLEYHPTLSPVESLRLAMSLYGE